MAMACMFITSNMSGDCVLAAAPIVILKQIELVHACALGDGYLRKPTPGARGGRQSR